jgi:3-oxoacyl-[acyl-carrier-protein] synthase II
MHKRVVVSGVGTVNAAGLGIEATWRRLRSDPPVAKPLVGPPPAEHVVFPLFQVEPYRLEDAGVPAAVVGWVEREGLAELRDLGHLLASVALALADAGLPADCSGERLPAAMVVGDESPGFEPLCRTLFELGGAGPLPERAEERFALLEQRFFRLNTFLLPHYLARAFRCFGLSLFVNSACTSGLSALEIAAQEIRAGRSRIAVAAAADDPASVAKFLWFQQLGLYATDGVIRPYDRHGRGLVFGDGGAALVLEELESALARGARIYAEYLGAAFSQDGWKITVPAPDPPRALSALRSALEQCGLGPGDVGLLVPHGAGSPASDQYEAEVMHRLFGEERGWPLVTALKPYVGHNLGGSALLETALLMRILAASLVPPTLGHGTPLRRNPVPLVDRWTERPITNAVKLTCGFAGFYGAAVFRRPPVAPAAEAQGSAGEIPASSDPRRLQ